MRFCRTSFVALMLMLSACDNTTAPIQSRQLNEGSYAAQFSTDGRWIVMAPSDTPAQLWDRLNNSMRFQWQSEANSATNSSQFVAFSNRGQLAATVEQNTVMLWRTGIGEPLHRMTLPYAIRAIAISDDEQFMLVALANRTAVYFDIANNRVVHTFQHGGDTQLPDLIYRVLAVAISPDGKYAVTGGDDWHARVWNLQTGEQVYALQHGNNVNVVDYDPTGQWLFTAAENDRSRVWQAVTGQAISQLRHSAWPKKLAEPNWSSFKTTTTAVAFSSDGRYLVSGHANNKVCLWTLPRSEKVVCQTWPRQQILRPGNVVQAVYVDANKRVLSAIGGDGWLHEWTLP